jgi:hypothetical protein
VGTNRRTTETLFALLLGIDLVGGYTSKMQSLDPLQLEKAPKWQLLVCSSIFRSAPLKPLRGAGRKNDKTNTPLEMYLNQPPTRIKLISFCVVHRIGLSFGVTLKKLGVNYINLS